MSREVMQQAIEFAEFVWRECTINDYAEEKRSALEDALRAELAKPERCDDVENEIIFKTNQKPS